MTFSPVTSHPTPRDATLDDRLDIKEPALARVLPADVKKAEELDSNETNIIGLFEKKNYKVHL